MNQKTVKTYSISTNIAESKYTLTKAVINNDTPNQLKS